MASSKCLTKSSPKRFCRCFTMFIQRHSYWSLIWTFVEKTFWLLIHSICGLWFCDTRSPDSPQLIRPWVLCLDDCQQLPQDPCLQELMLQRLGLWWSDWSVMLRNWRIYSQGRGLRSRFRGFQRFAESSVQFWGIHLDFDFWQGRLKDDVFYLLAGNENYKKQTCCMMKAGISWSNDVGL